MNRKDVVLKIKELLYQISPTSTKILYGSEARGDAKMDSDIDLLILIDGDTLSIEQEQKITAPLYEIEASSGVAISPIVMLKKQWENRPIKTPFYINVMKEGILL